MATAKKTTAKADDDILKNFAADTLVGDTRTFLLDRMKSQPKPWQQMNQQEQENAIHAAQEAAEKLVKEAIALVAAEGKKTVRGTLKRLTIADGIQAVISIGKGTGLGHELMDAQGQVVSITVIDADKFIGEKAPEKATPDQPDLSFTEESETEENTESDDEEELWRRKTKK